MASNVILIGMMGSGKTTVGRYIAAKTGREFIDLDEMIVDAQERSITEIFSADGEESFRAMETRALQEIRPALHAVIATGGGIIVRPENRELLRQLGTIFWLDAPPEVLLNRIGDDESRPKLQGGDALKRLKHLLAERRELYAETSHFHLDTSELTPEDIANRILKEIDSQSQQDTALFASIVAIDGPVGSGKSAVARLLAQRLHYTHIDTGAMYRAVTYEAMRRDVSLEDGDAITELAQTLEIRFQDPDVASQTDSSPAATAVLERTKRVFVNGEDVTDGIRTPEVSRGTSPVADAAGVRAEMVRLQRQLALRGRCVLEGRDISTVVVPEAKWKFYLTASLEERVNRRHDQYRLEGRDIDRDALRKDVRTRDERDRMRPQGALKLASDAIIFDTTGFSLEQVVDTLATLIDSSAPQRK